MKLDWLPLVPPQAGAAVERNRTVQLRMRQQKSEGVIEATYCVPILVILSRFVPHRTTGFQF